MTFTLIDNLAGWRHCERFVHCIVDCHIIGYLLSLIIIRCGLKVMGVTCDGNSANRRFYKLHSKEEVYKVKNPFTSEDRPIYFSCPTLLT